MPLMFGESGPVAKSFIQPLIKAMTSGIEVNLFTDEYRTPVSGKNAAEGIMVALNTMPGVIHLGGSERISRYDFGNLLLEIFKPKHATLNPVRQKDLNMPAPRPPDVSLDSSKAMELGFGPNTIRTELEYLRDVIDV